MKNVVDPIDMAAADRHTIDHLGIEGPELMARAGKSCVRVLLNAWPDSKNGKILALAGPGNNGGDAWVMAEILRHLGKNVEVVGYGTEEKLTPDARYFFEIFRKNGGRFRFQQSPLKIEQGTQWILDGLLGTGLKGPPRGPLHQWIQAINECPAQVLAIDIPSGCYPGCQVNQAVQADLCVTFQALKPAHVVSPTCYCCGEIWVADIGISMAPGWSSSHYLLEGDDFHGPERRPTGHKGTYGTLGILGGARGMEGASALAGISSLRMGAGKTRVYTENPDSPKFATLALMTDTWQGDFEKDDYRSWVIGPGLSRRDKAIDAIERIDLSTKSSLWDADGLFFFPKFHPKLTPESWVITPHPGEAAHLLNSSAKEIQENRLESVKALAKTYPGGWTVLKGDRTMVCSPNGTLMTCLCGAPSLAVAGSGDVLAGMIGGLMSQGIGIENAVKNGVLRHALAGENWSQEHPDYAMLPEDLLKDLCCKPKQLSWIKEISVHEGISLLYE